MDCMQKEPTDPGTQVGGAQEACCRWSRQEEGREEAEGGEGGAGSGGALT